MLFKIASLSILLVAMLGCSSEPNEIEVGAAINNPQANNITLSHVKAYLLNGNIQKAEQLYNTIDATELNMQSLLVLAELHAATGNSIDAQRVFLSALADSKFNLSLNKNIPPALLDYFCEQKKWPALKGYGAATRDTDNEESVTLANETQLKNETFTKIGLCFFSRQRWEDTKYWLELVDLTASANPLVYLALARVNVEQQQYALAQDLIIQYEQKKDSVDAQSMWTSIEVYLALKQPEMVTKVGEGMRSIFSFNQYTSKYILLTKRGRIDAITDVPTYSSTLIKSSAVKTKDAIDRVHTIRKGETLYQLSKRYGVTVPELMSWNPELVINDIDVGTPIRIIAPNSKLN